MILPRNFHSLLPAQSAVVWRQKLAAHSSHPAALWVQILQRKNPANDKTLGRQLLTEREWVTVFTLQTVMWKTRSHKRSQRSCLLATYSVCSPNKGKAICSTSNEAAMTKDFKRTYEECQTLWIKMQSEQGESHSSLRNLYSAVKCASL